MSRCVFCGSGHAVFPLYKNNKNDVNRAKNISFAAIIFCAAEILAGVITAIILLSQI